MELQILAGFWEGLVPDCSILFPSGSPLQLHKRRMSPGGVKSLLPRDRGNSLKIHQGTLKSHIRETILHGKGLSPVAKAARESLSLEGLKSHVAPRDMGWWWPWHC